MGANPTHSAAALSNERPVDRSMNAVRSIVRAFRVNTRAIELKMGISLAQLFVLQQLTERPADSLNELAERGDAQAGVGRRAAAGRARLRVAVVVVRRPAADRDRRHARRARAARDARTIRPQLMTAATSEPRRAEHAGELLERWLREAKIDFASPPMLGEDEVAAPARH
jgi:hypothetical protein